MAFNDFDGDGRSDLLWRNDSGAITNWLATGAGGFANNDANAWAGLTAEWIVVGTGDFNGDGRDDILWTDFRDGLIGDFVTGAALAQANGQFVVDDGAANPTMARTWQVVGVGDFNADHRDDLLWRDQSGLLTSWLATDSGGFVVNPAAADLSVDPSWRVVGVGDYNGDGVADILWRHESGLMADWLGAPDGGFTATAAEVWVAPDPSWRTVPEANDPTWSWAG